MDDPRQTSRYSVNEPVRVWSSGDPKSVANGVIRDISDDGVGLTLQGYFPVGSTIELECKKCLVHGTVIFCRETMPGVLDPSFNMIGITIDHVEWRPAEEFRGSAQEPLSIN
jgi:hypothetical protein